MIAHTHSLSSSPIPTLVNLWSQIRFIVTWAVIKTPLDSPIHSPPLDLHSLVILQHTNYTLHLLLDSCVSLSRLWDMLACPFWDPLPTSSRPLTVTVQQQQPKVVESITKSVDREILDTGLSIRSNSSYGDQFYIHFSNIPSWASLWTYPSQCSTRQLRTDTTGEGGSGLHKYDVKSPSVTFDVKTMNTIIL